MKYIFKILSMLNTIQSSCIHLDKYINSKTNAYKYQNIKADYKTGIINIYCIKSFKEIIFSPHFKD